MSQVRFQLKEPTSKEETLLNLIYFNNGIRFKYSTGIKLKPKYWNKESQQARITKEFNQAESINNYIRQASTHLQNIHRDLLSDGIIPTNILLKSKLDVALLRKSNINANSFVDFITSLIENSTKKTNTIKHYNQTLRQLTEFKKESKNQLLFEDINLNFYDEFMKFCLRKNYGVNTIGGFVKHIKVFMNEAFDRKLTSNIEYKNKRFRTLQEETETIYLTAKELELIYNYDFSENTRLDNVRDMFIISCYTGLRYSDLMQISENNLIDNSTKLKIKTEKTGELVIIPLHKYIREILAKHNGFPSYRISNQKMNEYLKELGALVEINKNILISSTRGGNSESTNFKKYELITVHTARRSFATNAYLMNVPSISIMKITGHRTEKAFLKYIKISQEENANKLINYPFFK